MYYVYVLQDIGNKNTKLHIGYSADLKKRVQKHKSKSVKSTKNFKEIKLIYYEACINETDARKREIQLKTGFGRGYIKRRLNTYLTSTLRV